MKVYKGTVIAVIFGLLCCLLVAAALGENPLTVLHTLLLSSFGSFDGFSYALFYTTPLIFTGLSVAVAFHAGLFNIGAEGQLYMGSLFLTAAAFFLPTLPSPVAKITALLAALLGGGLWGGLAGFLKAKRGSHEVIVTILLNFVAYAVCSYFILGIFKNPLNQSTESVELNPHYFLHVFSPFSPLNTALFLALLSAVFIWFLLFKTTWGLEVRMIGTNPETARRTGVPIHRRIIEAMFVSGALAGLVGINEILGNSHKFKDQYSPGYGFVGIAVTLVARNNPWAILASALLFGILSKGSLDLELDTEKITRDMALVMQGLIILFVAGQNLWVRKKHDH